VHSAVHFGNEQLCINSPFGTQMAVYSTDQARCHSGIAERL